jgi:hypothetical protein
MEMALDLKGRPLTDDEIGFVVGLVIGWIRVKISTEVVAPLE